ncbi:hypothetical protein NPX13_g11346 [Xylaria arbuscula]|uniref:Uncharacterized protein n=1 Tax=Xylaria arbuscula TaxID=114810 RepID=A0A9W8TFX3_9PEZI|nr:hypothetical protein NPX13_g11346 [Xylaria arbuscula]
MKIAVTVATVKTEEDRHDRGYERRERNDDGYGRVDRYGGPREDRERYGPRGGGGGSGGDERRGPGYERDRYDRPDRDGQRAREPAASGYGEAAPRNDGREPYASAP